MADDDELTSNVADNERLLIMMRLSVLNLQSSNAVRELLEFVLEDDRSQEKKLELSRSMNKRLDDIFTESQTLFEEIKGLFHGDR